ncbi:hypothetical protein PIB30_025816 [Stylosanthes scabra]|uniref:Uncharacterized protein n=1 Tax=Stylosanthes scabra TaxID=79078 RepID=A0ABU6U9F5_9FABA|nr:hypothetical protein [Stylosanthes scabra]
MISSNLSSFSLIIDLWTKSDEGDVDTETAVLVGAFETHEDAVGDIGPLRFLLRAATADLVRRFGMEVQQPPRCRHSYESVSKKHKKKWENEK